MEIAPGEAAQGADFQRLAFDDPQRRAVLLGDDRRDAVAQDARLFVRDLFDRRAEEFDMVDRHRGDHGRRRPLDHVGGVVAAAEPDLEQQIIGGGLAEEDKGGGGGDLEHRD
jgi:hypothetical protein